MAKRGAAEAQMRKVTDKGEAEVRELHGDHVVKIIPSWIGVELILDVKLDQEGKVFWQRYEYQPDDSLEVAGVTELV